MWRARPQLGQRSAKRGPSRGCQTRRQWSCQPECGPHGCSPARAQRQLSHPPLAPSSSSTSATKPGR
eukprot:2837511-Alexandrium_andersonii.AAC.1